MAFAFYVGILRIVPSVRTSYLEQNKAHQLQGHGELNQKIVDFLAFQHLLQGLIEGFS